MSLVKPADRGRDAVAGVGTRQIDRENLCAKEFLCEKENLGKGFSFAFMTT